MKFWLLAIVAAFIFLPGTIFAQVESFSDGPIEVRALVEEVVEEKLEPKEEAYQVVQVKITTEGRYQDESFTVDSRDGYLAGLRYEVDEGQEVKLSIIPTGESSQPTILIIDVIRIQALVWLTLIFIAITLAVGLLRGITSLIGLGVITLVLFFYILPQIIQGHDPVITTLLGSGVILLFSIFGTHGFRKSSWASFLGTIGGLVITGVLAVVFVKAASLTGLAGEQAALLQLKTGLTLDSQGLLLAAIIIGAVGVLDDAAVNQTEIVFELAKADPTLSRVEIFRRSMRIGRHHIASMVNTLVLAYAGASLPLLLLFSVSDESVIGLLNSEFIAEEIVRTLVGTIGLISAVPLAAWFGAVYAKKKIEK